MTSLEASRRATSAALAVSLAQEEIAKSSAELMVPGGLAADVELFTRGMGRSELTAVIGHLTMCVRAFADAVDVGQRDQILAALERDPVEVLVQALSGGGAS